MFSQCRMRRDEKLPCRISVEGARNGHGENVSNEIKAGNVGLAQKRQSAVVKQDKSKLDNVVSGVLGPNKWG